MPRRPRATISKTFSNSSSRKTRITSTMTKAPTTARRTFAWRSRAQARSFRSPTASYSLGPGREFFSSNTGAPPITAGSSSRSWANSVNLIYQPARLLVRQERLLHLVHDISEGNAVFRIGESVAPAGAGMAESGWRWTENARLDAGRIFHESGGERGRDLQDAIGAGDERRGHLRDRLRVEEAAAFHFAAIREHSVELRKRRRAPNPAEGNDARGAILSVVHRGDGMQPWR